LQVPPPLWPCNQRPRRLKNLKRKDLILKKVRGDGFQKGPPGRGKPALPTSNRDRLHPGNPGINPQTGFRGKRGVLEKKVLESTIFYRRLSMNPQEIRRFQVGHSIPEACVSNFGGVLVSTIIVGFALIIISIFASFELLIKNSVK
jgi:hypothetical protein